jgi:hypothetical protein
MIFIEEMAINGLCLPGKVARQSVMDRASKTSSASKRRSTKREGQQRSRDANPQTLGSAVHGPEHITKRLLRNG